MRRVVVLTAVLATACAPVLPASVVALGTPFADGGLTMTIVDAGIAPRVSEEYWPGHWLVVDLDVSAGDGIAWFNGMNQELFVNGDRYLPDVAAAETASEDTVSGASLLPGASAEVALAFRVGDYSADSKVELVVRGDVDSPGVVVTLPGSALQ